MRRNTQTGSKHVICARSVGRVPATRYFLRYAADPALSVPRWTKELHKARWLDDDEIDAEVAMLAALCPADVIQSESLRANTI
jgi:hypothetical protein